jgi:anti-sigma factor RsiW
MTMHNQTICGDGQMLVAYLYDECDAAERVRVERHLESCDACATELAELGSARQHLAVWAPPEPALGFRIAPERPAAAAPCTWRGGGSRCQRGGRPLLRWRCSGWAWLRETVG